MARFTVIFITLVVAMGAFVYGFDSGIIATTLGQENFKLYFFGPTKRNASLAGAVVSLYNAGQAIGGLCCGHLADKLSRKFTISTMSLQSIIGAALQVGAVNIAMMIVGRFIAGIACGVLLAIVSVYIAEVSPPTHRGFMVGLHGMVIALGYGAAGWIGYAGSFASGQAQWRIPLGMQIPVPIVLSVAACFVPFSPRWLLQQNREDEAAKVLFRLHGDEGFANQELVEIRDQINLEKSYADTTWAAAMASSFIVSMSQVSGASVIQNFQSIFFETVGFTGRQSLLMSAAYGMVGIAANTIHLAVVADRWPRVRTLWTGSLLLSIMITVCMALSAVYGSGGASRTADSGAGARAAIAMIFLYQSVYGIFFNSVIWIVPSELFPFFLRSKGLSLSVTARSIVAIVLSQITPVALADISWRFYAVFIATTSLLALFTSSSFLRQSRLEGPTRAFTSSSTKSS
ncbi:hypothetical protein MAPG_11492 [Magnaporthiopsis poae ATCC 64411]|uniref:Major facilitator superfamily (MFS) profile domain-containing protein n=1 Tax=Magnaporthiopsis poae (strain ATCC 64411 / 73-15) TaxID=644358 RepID=A0A0C4EFE9_MAGP6|nr:hypothetical protein MAPG_11492 [Magnaporthiopsis poae ATCC 64411]